MPTKKDSFDEYFDNTDFGDSVGQKAVIPGKAGRKKIGKKVAVTLPESIILELQELAQERALGYQTLIRIFVLEKLKEEREKRARKSA